MSDSDVTRTGGPPPLRAFLVPMASLLCVALVAGALAVGAKLLATPPVAPDRVLPADAAGPDLASDAIHGSPQAPVTVYAFVSLGCAVCARWEREEMPAFIRDQVDTGRARLVLRAYPLDATDLLATSMIACSDPKERREVHAALMATQDMWRGKGPQAVVDSVPLPSRGQATVACMVDPTNVQSIATTAHAFHDRWGVSATPTFVVGRRSVRGSLQAVVLADMVRAATPAIQPR